MSIGALTKRFEHVDWQARARARVGGLDAVCRKTVIAERHQIFDRDLIVAERLHVSRIRRCDAVIPNADEGFQRQFAVPSVVISRTNSVLTP